jgi:hypothetical protein
MKMPAGKILRGHFVLATAAASGLGGVSVIENKFS